METKQEKFSVDYEEFKNRAIANMKVGKALVGKDGVCPPHEKILSLSEKEDPSRQKVAD